MTASSTSPARNATTQRKTRAAAFGAIALATALALGACTRPIEVHGNIPDEEMISALEAGQHDRNDVLAILGTPSTISTFEDSTWYYIGSRMRQRAFLNPEELERSVLVVSFDQAGRVAETTRLNLEDSQEIALVARETPTEGQDMTVLQQLFGNLGRFVPEEGGPVARTPRPTRY